MMDVGFLPIKRCMKCRKRYRRWTSVEKDYFGRMVTICTPLLEKGYCYPCFTVENLKLDVEIAKAEICGGGE
jgi:hypothetical protein